MLFPCIQMPNERFSAALSRLEAALARVEAATKSRASGPDASDYAALAARHDRLRASVGAALDRIDALIDGGGVVGNG